jgi:hypothetical protein
VTENFISWNVVNWITVLLMVAVGFTLIGLGTGAVNKMRGA